MRKRILEAKSTNTRKRSCQILDSIALVIIMANCRNLIVANNIYKYTRSRPTTKKKAFILHAAFIALHLTAESSPKSSLKLSEAAPPSAKNVRISCSTLKQHPPTSSPSPRSSLYLYQKPLQKYSFQTQVGRLSFSLSVAFIFTQKGERIESNNLRPTAGGLSGFQGGCRMRGGCH